MTTKETYDEQKEYDELPERISTSVENNMLIMQAMTRIRQEEKRKSVEVAVTAQLAEMGMDIQKHGPFITKCLDAMEDAFA